MKQDWATTNGEPEQEWWGILVFSRQNYNLGTPALVNKDRHQPESRLIVSFTVLQIQHFLSQLRKDRLWGQQWTSLSPEGTPTLKTILNFRKEHFYFSECLLPLTLARDLLTGKGPCKLYCVETCEGYLGC